MTHAPLMKQKNMPAVLSILLFGIFFGVFLWNTFVGDNPVPYPLQFETEWTAFPSPPVRQSYFRQRVNIDNLLNIKNAWLRISAPDSFTLYVNGKAIGSSALQSEINTGVYNITSEMKSGLNVIAISNQISIYDRSRVLVEGFYEDFAGRKMKLLSGGQWRVSSYAPNLLDSDLQWYEVLFPDADWVYASPLSRSMYAKRYQIPFSPSIFAHALEGDFVSAGPAAGQSLFLRYPVDTDGQSAVRDVWLRMLVEEGNNYGIMVNGVPIAHLSTIVPGMPEAGPSDLNVYRITPYLHKGRNIVGIYAYSGKSVPRVYADGLVSYHGGQEKWFSFSRGGKYATTLFKDWTQQPYEDSHWKTAVLAGMTNKADIPKKFTLSDTTPTGGYVIRLFLFKYAFITLIALVTSSMWGLLSVVLSRIRDLDISAALSLTGLINFLLFLTLAVIYILGFDIRLYPAFPYQLQFVVLAVALGGGMVLCALLWKYKNAAPLIPGSSGSALTGREYLFIALMIAAGFLLRIYAIDFKPLNGDEGTMYFFTRGLIDNFYPNLNIINSPPHRILTTSELEPYFVSIGLLLFGPNEFGLRFASAVFGSLTIVLLYFTGREFLGKRVGILASTVYTIMPITINYAKFARYPSQVQFFSLLTTYLFLRTVSEKEISPKYIYWTGLSFMLTYLSWEGAGFLLPALFVALLLHRKNDFSWIKSRHLWLSVGLVVFFVFCQLCLRYSYVKANVLGIGAAIGSVSIAPQWNQPVFDVLFYLNNFFLVDNIFMLSLFFGLGLTFFLKDKVLTVLYGIILTVTFFMTFFFEIKTTRYLYFVLPMVVLSGGAVFFRVLDYLAGHRNNFSIFWGRAVTFLACAVIVLPSNDFIMKPYNNPAATYQSFSKSYFYDISNRDAISYLKSHVRPGDVMVSNWPHVFQVWLGRCEYYAANNLSLPVLLLSDSIAVGHRITGAPLVYTIENLNEMFSRHRRLWVVFSSFDIGYIEESFKEHIKKNARAMYEDNNTMVYLWER